MDTYDLIPDINLLETLFVMESPHSEELTSCIPCNGATGINMSLKILNLKEPFGQILSNGVEIGKKYGIMNTFPFPLGIKSGLTKSQSSYCCFKKVEWIKGKTTRNQFYQQHFELLNDLENLEAVTAFKQRFTKYIKNSPNLKNIVFCGFISQSVYLKSFNQQILKYNVAIKKKTQSGKIISIIFTNHPSDKNINWDFNMNYLN